MIADRASLLAEAAELAQAPAALSRASMLVPMAEGKLSRLLRLPGQEARATVTTDAEGYADLPADFVELAAVIVAARPAQRISAAEANAGKRGVAVEGKRVRSYWGETEHALDYWARVPPLMDAASGSTWLLADEPELYLAAVVGQIAGYEALRTGDEAQAARAAASAQLVQQLAADANLRAAEMRYGGARMQIEGMA